MKDRALFMLMIPLLTLFASGAIAQDEDKRDKNPDPHVDYASEIQNKDKFADVVIPPGMELKKIGSLNLVVPIGAQIRKDRSQWIMEGPEDFAARSISEIKARLDDMEKEQGELKKSIEELKESIRINKDKKG